MHSPHTQLTPLIVRRIDQLSERHRACNNIGLTPKPCLVKLDLAKHVPKHPHHVAAEDFADVFGRIVSSAELGRQIFTIK